MEKNEKTDSARTHPNAPTIKLERRGGVTVMSEACTSTATAVKATCSLLEWDVRKAEQYITHNQKRRWEPDRILSGLKQDFGDTKLVGNEERPGFADEDDLRKLIRSPSARPSEFAIGLVADRTGLTPNTIQTYTRRKVRRGKPRRKSL